MKVALLGLLIFSSHMLADSMLSLQEYIGGSPACANTDPLTVACTAQASSIGNGTGAYTNGSLKLEGSGLVYTLNGFVEAGQGILARSNPMAAFSLTLPVSDTSGNWIVSGSAAASGSPRYALNIFANGSPAGLIGNGSNSFEVHHALGAPLTFTLADNVAAFFPNDIERLNFSLTFTDPPADAPSETPEPNSLLLVGAAILVLLNIERLPAAARH